MKATVINLDRRPDRWVQFYAQNGLDLHIPFQRFSAIEAGCGEDGCTASHLEVLCQQTEFPFVVFEDDCVLLEKWSFVEEAMKQLPKDWDALWLGANPRKPLIKYSENLRVLKDAYCLHAVIYNSKRMVDYILENHNTPSGKNLDIFYKTDVQKKFKCFSISPIVATQLSDQSDIAPGVTNNYDEIIANYQKFTK